jgi:hypothetical protein
MCAGHVQVGRGIIIAQQLLSHIWYVLLVGGSISMLSLVAECMLLLAAQVVVDHK